jgi:hypothetical protein
MPKSVAVNEVWQRVRLTKQLIREACEVSMEMRQNLLEKEEVK